MTPKGGNQNETENRKTDGNHRAAAHRVHRGRSHGPAPAAGGEHFHPRGGGAGTARYRAVGRYGRAAIGNFQRESQYRCGKSPTAFGAGTGEGRKRGAAAAAYFRAGEPHRDAVLAGGGRGGLLPAGAVVQGRRWQPGYLGGGKGGLCPRQKAEIRTGGSGPVGGRSDGGGTAE